MSGCRDEIGYVPREPRKGRKPPTDAEWLRSRFGNLETRDTGDDLCPWMARMRRKSGKLVDFYGRTESEALARARAWAEAEDG